MHLTLQSCLFKVPSQMLMNIVIISQLRPFPLYPIPLNQQSMSHRYLIKPQPRQLIRPIRLLLRCRHQPPCRIMHQVMQPIGQLTIPLLRAYRQQRPCFELSKHCTRHPLLQAPQRRRHLRINHYVFWQHPQPSKPFQCSRLQM